LSSGSKIVEPQDDAAGLAVSSRFDAQINRTEATRANIGNAISFKQTQDGYLGKVAKALDRMSELATMAQDESKTTADLSLYDKEFQTLSSYIDLIDSQSFNAVALFTSGALNVVQQEEHTTKFASSGINLAANTAAITALGITSAALGSSALTTIKSQISAVAEYRATIGADLSRLMKTDLISFCLSFSICFLLIGFLRIWILEIIGQVNIAFLLGRCLKLPILLAAMSPFLLGRWL